MSGEDRNRSCQQSGLKPRSPRRASGWSLLLSLGALLLCPSLRAQTRLVGTYRCTSTQVGRRTGLCGSPPLILYADGSYRIWGEEGTYTVRGHWLILSESKKRGAGRLRRGREIVFQYTYRGKRHTVKFRREYSGSSALA